MSAVPRSTTSRWAISAPRPPRITWFRSASPRRNSTCSATARSARFARIMTRPAGSEIVAFTSWRSPRTTRPWFTLALGCCLSWPWQPWLRPRLRNLLPAVREAPPWARSESRCGVRGAASSSRSNCCPLCPRGRMAACGQPGCYRGCVWTARSQHGQGEIPGHP